MPAAITLEIFAVISKEGEVALAMAAGIGITSPIGLNPIGNHDWKYGISIKVVIDRA